MNVDISLTKKQSIAWKYLTDDVTNVINFGGAASGGKSFLGCLFVTTMCLRYSGVRYLIGRTVLQQLRLTTLNTLFEVFSLMKLKPSEHYNYNGQTNVITFYNKSEIILKDLQFNPSDPQFESLGSLEITGAFIDESSQITSLCYNIIKSRIRYKLNQYKLIPKLLLTCNPSNNWIKKEFYIPYVQGTLESNKIFIQSFVSDNPHVPESYINLLQELPTQQKKRLLFGDWDYLDEADSLFNFDDITLSVFKYEPNPNEKKYMTVDVARFGEDKSVIFIWVGFTVISCHTYSKIPTTQLIDEIRDLMRFHGIHPQQVIIDSDGVGGPVSDAIRSVNFVNNARPFHEQNYVNLKTQCYVKLSELFKEQKISINILDPMIVDELTQELLSIKLKNLDKDQRIGVISKEELKKILGKSTDLSDSMMMRCYFEVKNRKTTGKYSLSFI